MKSDRTLLKWYRKVNKKYFDNQLPHNVCVRWSSEDEDDDFEDKYDGEANLCDDGIHKYQIVISSDLRTLRVAVVSTIVHEMIHIATELKDDHGPAFNEILNTLIEKGILKKHALLKHCTLF